MDKAKLARVPDSAGVYIFKDKKGNILYIGKARSLKKRVRSYFTRPQSLKMQIMSSKIFDLDYIVTKSEAQARLKEARLIQQNLPPYNTVFRDNKSFPLICISKGDFPVVWFARKTNRRLRVGVLRYLGPYTNAAFLRMALKSIRRIFGFRSCFKLPKRPCLYYRLKLCPAPCIGRISIQKYKDIITNIILFLEGKHENLINKLTVKMHKLANQSKFEEAAQVRDQIQALSSIFQEDIPALSESYRASLELKEVLGIDTRPRRIEAFDVSNIFGSCASASMVSFYEGNPDKANYRRFRIKSVSGINDYQMLREAVGRRYLRLIDEQLPLPDLIIIDGGKGQLNIVKNKLKELGIAPSVISIAKQKEEIFTTRQQASIRLKPNSLALHLIQRIRDEAHRFALAYHRTLRKKRMMQK